jgi:hypothetical protein
LFSNLIHAIHTASLHQYGELPNRCEHNITPSLRFLSRNELNGMPLPRGVLDHHRANLKRCSRNG